MSAVPTQLQRLAHRIGDAAGLAPDALASEVTAALRDATSEAGWLPPERRRADHQRYARHLLYGDPAGRFSILSLVWDHGQESPIHGHHTWCAVGVYDGELTEIRFREDAAGRAPVEIGSERRIAGSLSFDLPLASIHRIANRSGVVAISLHVYGVAADRVASGVNRIYETA
jgi:predicted metal-dependent enzyme (double-stranded beta helix superfamily)